VAASQAQRTRQPLPRRHLVPPADPRRFARALRLAANALGVPIPELEVAPEQREPVRWALCLDGGRVAPLLRVGGPLLDDKRADSEIAFIAGHEVALLRPARVIRWLLPLPEQLGHMIEAALTIGAASRGPTAAAGELATTVAGLRRELTPMALDQLAGVGLRLAESPRAPIELAREWLIASDRSAVRAGLAISGDLAASKAALEAWTANEDPMPRRVVDLLWSSVTEDLFAVEAHLVSAQRHEPTVAPESRVAAARQPGS
jgi:hypothetical protein